MTPDEAPVDPTCEQRVQAVLAWFRGEPVTQVSTQYRGFCRKFTFSKVLDSVSY